MLATFRVYYMGDRFLTGYSEVHSNELDRQICLPRSCSGGSNALQVVGMGLPGLPNPFQFQVFIY